MKKTVSCTLEKEIYEQLKKMADKTMTPLSRYINQAVIEFLSKHKE